MKILVTGGRGVVGTPLVEELRKRGHVTCSLDIKTGKDDDFECDISDHYEISKVFEKNSFDLIYHLAAVYGRYRGEDRYRNLWMTNAVGTKNIIRLQEKFGFKMVIFSSSEVYGERKGLLKESMTEESFGKLHNDYALTKWVNEQQVKNSRIYEKTIIVRPSGLYGKEPYDPYRGLICKILHKCLKNEPFTIYKSHRRTFLYIDDAVRTFANIAERFKSPITYNITGEHGYSIKEVYEILITLFSRAKDLVIFKETEPSTVIEKRLDSSLARKDLGLEETVSLKEGLALTLDWMRKEER